MSEVVFTIPSAVVIELARVSKMGVNVKQLITIQGLTHIETQFIGNS